MNKLFIFIFLLSAFPYILFSQHDHHLALPPVVKDSSVNTANDLNQETEKFNQPPGKRVVYHLYVADTIVNFSGKNKRAIAINGSIPAPTLYFTEGDTAEIYVHNLLKKETTSIHWHGIILPNRYDGVPNLTTAPIQAGETLLFEFPIVQNGTYWYHSHTELQEQSGMYGALIFHKVKEPNIKVHPVIFSDWTDERPKEVHRSLHAATDWYSIKKGSTQSYSEAVNAGYFKTKLKNEWKRMVAMDVSDISFDRFLANGKLNETVDVKAGEKIKLRIINGSAASYFWLTYAGGKMTVVANDGEDVEPVEVDRLIIAVAETYDIIVTVPDNMQYEFTATAEDRTGYVSLWLGHGMQMPSAKLPRLNYFEGMKMMNGMMKLNGDMDDMGMQMSNQVMDMNMVMYPELTNNPKEEESGHNHASAVAEINTLNYSMLRSPYATTLPDAPVQLFHFELTGNMNRFVWSIDNKTVSEAEKIYIRKGDNIRIIMTNNTMMRHPMHLHGHFFRVLNGQGDHAPLKNVLDIMPMETDTIEFAATESGDWFFHCHLLYHMMSGMGRIFSYENSPVNPALPDTNRSLRNLFSDDRQFHLMGQVGIETNGSDGEAMLSNTRWQIKTVWHLGYHAEHGYESETMVGRFLGKMQWWFPYAGFDYHYKKNGGPDNLFGDESTTFIGQKSNRNNRKAAVVGVEYTLPFLLLADARFDSDGNFRFQLGREDVPLSKRLRFNFMVNTDKEYMAGFRYVLTKYISLSTHYDSDMGVGAGVTFVY
jgi:FtsP/CotA-like multicopper oxidase with cupredoxin domain